MSQSHKFKAYLIPALCFAGGIVAMYFIIGVISSYESELSAIKQNLAIHDQNIKILANQTQKQIQFDQNIGAWAKQVNERLDLLNHTKK